jgi:hypothetical protein
VEGGPLLPVNTELYQSGLGAQALSALSNLARVTGKDDVSQQLAGDFAHQKQLVNQAFWSQQSGTYAFALDRKNQQVIEPSVLATVPMWFGLLDQQHAESMLNQLSSADHQTGWGMRIISDRASRYDAGGYHYGSVWPLFTGWASVGEYRYHRAIPAYENLRSNALLALDGSPGHVTEVLSGDYYQPLSTSSPHQIWSAAMVISPILRGLFGLETDAAQHRIVLAPHIPADWNSFAIHNLHAGEVTLDLAFHRTNDEMILSVESSGSATLEFSPAVSPRAKIISAELNGKRVQLQSSRSDFDQHLTAQLPLESGKNTFRIRVQNDFGITFDNVLPYLGSPSQGLRITSEAWSSSRDMLTLQAEGLAAAEYELAVLNPGQIASVEGAELRDGKLVVKMASNPHEQIAAQKIVIHFASH